ncbi:MAG: hypothetical protein RLZZ628_3145 [Bacteroidota bacterium]|jgi:hypothetical protein
MSLFIPTTAFAPNRAIAPTQKFKHYEVESTHLLWDKFNKSYQRKVAYDKWLRETTNPIEHHARLSITLKITEQTNPYLKQHLFQLRFKIQSL